MSGAADKFIDWGERAFVLLLSVPFLVAFAAALPTHPTLVLITASEMLAVVFILTRKSGKLVAAPLPVLAAFAGTAFPLLVRPGGMQIAPTVIGSTLMGCGMALAVASKLYLNRSFGLIAANRGVKVKGPYQFVRHPMYLGYMINQIGFLTVSLNATN